MYQTEFDILRYRLLGEVAQGVLSNPCNGNIDGREPALCSYILTIYNYLLDGAIKPFVEADPVDPFSITDVANSNLNPNPNPNPKVNKQPGNPFGVNKGIIKQSTPSPVTPPSSSPQSQSSP